ncbi:hypothetical protein [Mycobacterium malmoense]|uniref:hypothetical protein n=1 Tax=Mycobacterium malmoense TaxID=1780 RepID=UPI001130411B|nr:hypothetical protein [Mycobacterium malmoense]
MHLGDWLALAAISITIVQITRVGSLVRQVRDSLRSASARAAVYNVLSTAPRITDIAHQLDLAARHADTEAYYSALVSYRALAAELVGLLHQETRHGQDARKSLSESLAQIAAAKDLFTGVSPDNLEMRTTEVRSSIASASDATVALVARFRSDLLPIAGTPEPGVIKRIIISIRGNP